jgi:two-component system, OmpR family, sensor kinase
VRLPARRLFWPWVLWACACVVAMVIAPGQETIPYHLGYAALALAAGLDAWSHPQSVVALGGYTLLTGLVLVSRAASGTIAWEETAEIPLMCLLMVMVIWHMERRNTAITRVTQLAERERSQRERRERLVRITSHEMRTPLSIASGYVDLLTAGEVTPQASEDLAVIREELDRLSLATGRMLRLIRLYEDLPVAPVDVDELLRVTATRWHVVASRSWQVEARLGVQVLNEERVRACLDTLIENAVRYTGIGDVIRLFAYQRDGLSFIGVADSGQGFNAAQLEAINVVGSEGDPDVPLVSDPRSQTGLGLSLVREVVESRGARLMASVSTEGGGEVSIIGLGNREYGHDTEPDRVFPNSLTRWWSTTVAPAPSAVDEARAAGRPATPEVRRPRPSAPRR